MQLIFEGHACFRLISGKTEIIVDPYITDNPQCGKPLAAFHPDLILPTHGHGDHLGDALELARASGATLAAQVDLLRALDCRKLTTIGFNLGGAIRFREFSVTMVQAWHGSTVTTPQGPKYGGVACGYIIADGKHTVYHAGDTALFGDMAAVISRYALTAALLPVGGYFTMGPDDAALAAEWLQAGIIIPMHYNTWPNIRQDLTAFQARIEAQGQRCLILAPGGACDLDA